MIPPIIVSHQISGDDRRNKVAKAQLKHRLLVGGLRNLEFLCRDAGQGRLDRVNRGPRLFCFRSTALSHVRTAAAALPA